MSAFRFRSEPCMDFVRRRRCIGEHTHEKSYNPFYSVIDPEHRISRKWNKGSDAETYPCCRVCHEQVHKMSKHKAKFWQARGADIVFEIVKWHNDFLLERGLTMKPEETFEECLERNGLGKHARGKNLRPLPGDAKYKKSKFWDFKKRFIPIKDR